MREREDRASREERGQSSPYATRTPDSYRDRLEELVHRRTTELEREVEERRRAQRALEQSEERYRRLFGASSDALLVFPLDQDSTPGNLVEANESARQLLGYGREELLQMSAADVLAFEGGDSAIPGLAPTLQSKSHLALEGELLARDGSRIPVEASLQILDLSGEQIVLCAARDITDRLRAQQDLQLISEGTVGLTGRRFFRALVQHVAQILRVRYALVAELDQGGTSARTLAFWDHRDWGPDFEFSLVGSPWQDPAAEQEWFYPSGAGLHYPGDGTLARLGVESHHGLALRSSAGEVMGALIVMDPQPMPHQNRNASILRLFSARAAAELERVRAEAALRRYAREQSALYAVTSALNRSLDPDDLLDTILEVLLPAAGADAGWITLPGHGPTQPPRTVAWKGLANEEAAQALAAPLDRCSVCAPHLHDSASSGEARVVRHCPHERLEVLARSGLQAQACVPLTARGRILGTLSLAWRGAHRLDAQDEALLLALAYQTGLGLHHAQLYQQARQVDHLRVLGELDRALAATLDPREVAEITVERMTQALNAPDALLLPRVAALGTYPRRVLTFAEGWIDLVKTSRYAAWRPFLDELHAHGEVATMALLPGNGGEVVAVPICNEGQPLAHLVLAGPILGDEQRLLAQAAAGRAAQAVRNAQLYAEVRGLLREREETQAQLIHSEKVAALGRLSASIAHEINNPIQAVQGCLGLAAEEMEADRRPEVLARYLSIAREEVKRIGSILHRMRDFYQPAGEALENTDVREVLEDVLALMARPLAHRRVEVERTWSDDVPVIQANANQLKQVFLNLVLNAADAMPEGGKLHISVNAGQPGDGGNWPPPVGARPPRAVRVEFRDHGVGIPAEQQGRLFEPFFTTKEHGSGLGLYISYGIIRSHQGRIVVHSREGEGTTITVVLPVGRPEAE